MDGLLDALVGVDHLAPVDELGSAELLGFDGDLEGLVEKAHDGFDVTASNPSETTEKIDWNIFIRNSDHQ